MPEFASDSESDSEVEVSEYDIKDFSESESHSDSVSNGSDVGFEEIEDLSYLSDLKLPSFDLSSRFSDIDGPQEHKRDQKETPDTPSATEVTDQWTRDFMEMLGERYFF